MPLPSRFDRASLVINGRSYDLVNVAVTDQSFEQEFGDVRGYGPRVVARTAGRVTERVTLEGELIEMPLTLDRIAEVYGVERRGATPAKHQEPLNALAATASKILDSEKPKSVWDRLLASE